MPEVVEEATAPQTETQQHGEATHPGPEKPSGSLKGIFFRLPVFEGPLDLLLHLIKEQKIDIYDIPIVEITQQYLQYIDMMKELNLEVAGDYLVMAATLIHIKSKMLLPVEEEGNEEPEEDPRAELVRRLLEYQAFKESTSHLRRREEVWKNVFQRRPVELEESEIEPEPVLVEASVFDLLSAFKKLLERAPEQPIEITRETLTVADRINFIVEKMEESDGMRFEDLFEPGFTRSVLIVTFLSLLELVRLGLLKIYQERDFGVIWLMKSGSKEDIPENYVPSEEVETSA
jgi:segregation and condensation protein A